MTQVIGVSYKYLDYEGAWHLALYYDPGTGDQNKRFIEAGPQNNPGAQISFGQAAAEIAKEQWSLTNENDGSPFGLLLGGDRG